MMKPRIGMLHFETMEWIHEVEFYLDEFNVLEELVKRKEDYSNLAKQLHKDIAHTISTVLDRLIIDFIHQLTYHEKHLSSFIMGNTKTSAELYLERHQKLAKTLSQLKDKVRELKKKIYRYLLSKKHEQRHGFPI
ncbi:hypothetical protein I2486_14750 [Cellulophaga sp. E16_2]|uniref:hypothetical protein n=1 Tax=Cellulophaga TaxID=104264 RepID=UPI0002ED0020|nr:MULTISPECIES: hypothetical protein [Cellulophaga]MBO0592661.1 hypothetical protein [Cellulophaga sp. E16_2]